MTKMAPPRKRRPTKSLTQWVLRSSDTIQTEIVKSAEALKRALESYEGTVIAVTHDRWFARSFTRFLIFGGDGQVYESPEPVGSH